MTSLPPCYTVVSSEVISRGDCPVVKLLIDNLFFCQNLFVMVYKRVLGFRDVSRPPLRSARTQEGRSYHSRRSGIHSGFQDSPRSLISVLEIFIWTTKHHDTDSTVSLMFYVRKGEKDGKGFRLLRVRYRWWYCLGTLQDVLMVTTR